MQKRPSSTIASVAAISQLNAQQRKKFASAGQKKRSKSSSSSVALCSFLVLLVALLLLRSSFLDRSTVAAKVWTEEEKVALFADWFRAEGGQFSHKIAIATFPGMGKGIVALETVKEDDELLVVPKNVIICVDTIEHEWSKQPKLKKTFAKLQKEQEELLTAFLLLEQAKGSSSRWAPYLQLLPSFSTRHEVASPLLFASDEDVWALQDEKMTKAANVERQQAKQAHGRFKRLFRPLVDEETLTLPRYVWARFLVNSRAFSIQGQRVLVPFGDIFNGEPDSESREHDNGQRFLHFHDLQDTGMTIRADRGTSKGHQLFEDYGDNSNYVYFLHHGFLMGDRGFDCAAFRLPALVDAYKPGEELLAQKTRVLARVRVEDAPLACISRAGKLEDPGLVRIYTAVYTMDAGQAAACDSANAFSECFPPELMSDLDDLPQQEEANMILGAVQRQLEQYPTTIEADLHVLNKGGNAGKALTHAIAFRLSRKQILLDAQTILEQRLQHLEQERGKTDKNQPLSRVGEQEYDDVGVGGSKLERFQQWIARHHFPINHLELRYVSEAVGYGTFAVTSLTRGDTYLSVPVQVVMNVHSALQSPWVRQVMSGLQKDRASVSRDEMLLLLHLLEEKFGPNHHQSRRKPYLDMLPDLDNHGSPLFYEENGEQLKALEGSDLLPLVTKYRQRVAQSFVALSDHFKRLQSDQTLAWLTGRRFLWANAVLDSRSIWWNSQRHLVPLLDMVNCQERDSEHKPHHTKLDSSGRQAVTKASWEFAAGEEIVENYAQPNYIYLLYHGFVLDENSHDCAHFHFEVPSSARQRKFAHLLQSLEVYSWTPDVCVKPSAEKAISRFAQIALLVLDPNEALQLSVEDAANSPRAISSALEVVNERLNHLQISADTSTRQDLRTQVIHRYRQQQFSHLQTLDTNLRAKLA